MKSTSRFRPLICMALAVLSGVLLAFALPPRNVSILGWIALLPLLVAVRMASRSLIGGLLGMAAALCTACILIRHIDNINQFGNLFAAFGSLALALAFTAGFASFGARRVKPGLWPLFVGAAGVSAEFLSRFVFPVTLALSQHANPGALHLASYTGIWGVSFVLWFVPASVIVFAIKPRRMWPAFAVAIAVLICANFCPSRQPTSGRMLRVAAIQAPDPYSAAEVTDALARRAEVVVWAEHLMYKGNRIPRDAAVRAGAYVVASFLEQPAKGKPYNSVCLISPRGETLARSRKVHLFGKERFVYSAGDEPSAVVCGGFKLGMPICFDTEFTDITRRLARGGADILFVGNSDPKMPNNLFQYLHSAIIPFRAAENGTPIVWAEDRSLSVIVDADGRVVARAPAFKVTSLLGAVRLRSGATFFTFAGDYFAYLCAAFLVVVAVSGRRILGKARAAGE